MVRHLWPENNDWGYDTGSVEPAAEPADDSAEEPAQEPSSDDTDTPEEAPAENEDIVIDPGEEKSQISCSSISLYDALSPVVFLGLLLGLKRRIQ